MLKFAGAVALLAVLLIVTAWLGQRRLIYFPSTERIEPATLGLVGVSEQVLQTPDGHRLVSWWGRARPGDPTILYFHGNGGGLAERAERIRTYHSRGIGMLMMSYRGYSGSTGTPSEWANVADAKLAYDWLITAGVAPADIVLYGESLGSGIATQLAAEKTVGGLILDAPYTSIVDLGAARYPFLPVRLLMLDRYETMRHIARVRAPILLLHGERDRVVPVEMGRAVFKAAPEPKQIATFPQAGHSDHHLYGSYDVVLAWLAELRRKPAP